MRLSQTATSGRSRSDRLELERGDLRDHERRGGQTRARRRTPAVPMFPHTATGTPTVRASAPIKSVVVLLPLVPVTHTKRARRCAPSQLELGEHRHARDPRRARQRMIDRDARAPDHEVAPGQRLGSVRHECGGDALRTELAGQRGALGTVEAPVGEPRLESQPSQQACGGKARAGGAHHERMGAREADSAGVAHCSLKVESESRASSAPAM